jgi:hypothetical protein
MDPSSIVGLVVAASTVCGICAKQVSILVSSGKKVHLLANELDLLSVALDACHSDVQNECIRLHQALEAEDAVDAAAARKRRQTAKEVKEGIEAGLGHIKRSLDYLQSILSGLAKSISSKRVLSRALLGPVKVWYRTVTGDIADEQAHIEQLTRALRMLLRSLSQTTQTKIDDSRHNEIRDAIRDATAIMSRVSDDLKDLKTKTNKEVQISLSNMSAETLVERSQQQDGGSGSSEVVPAPAKLDTPLASQPDDDGNLASPDGPEIKQPASSAAIPRTHFQGDRDDFIAPVNNPRPLPETSFAMSVSFNSTREAHRHNPHAVPQVDMEWLLIKMFLILISVLRLWNFVFQGSESLAVGKPPPVTLTAFTTTLTSVEIRTSTSTIPVVTTLTSIETLTSTSTIPVITTLTSITNLTSTTKLTATTTQTKHATATSRMMVTITKQNT